MTRFIEAKYHTALAAVEFVAEDQTHYIRTGGTLAWRLNNCGNMKPPLDAEGTPHPKKTKNFIGFAKVGDSGDYFFIFPDYETGRAEVKASMLRKYKDDTLAQMLRKYAPKRENNTEKYLNDLSKLSKIGQDEIIKDLGDERLNKMIDCIQQLEGFHASADTRKEKAVQVTHVQATNGTAPVANAEIVVKNGDKETTLKSNAAGRFPPIVHGKAPIEVHHKTADGNTKKVADIAPEKSGFMNLLTKAAEYVGYSAPKAPPAKPVPTKNPLLYTVQQKDILGRLAVRFQTTVAKIKQDNNLTSDKLMPGQVLRMHGPAPALTPAAPKQELKKKLAKPAAAAGAPASAPATSGTQKPAPVPAAKPAPPAAASTQSPAPAPAPKPSAPPAPAPASKPSAPAAKPPAAAEKKPAPKAKPVPPPEAETAPSRSKKGAGEAIALIPPQQGVAPWMSYAVQEAKRWKGQTEEIVEEEMNYHILIKDSRKTLVGDNDAWCAAFVNWCLLQAGYPITNPKETGWADWTAAKARAHGFMELRGQKTEKKQAYEKIPMVDNPLFYKIKEPIFGAIAINTSKAGHGHHAGLVYGRVDDKRLCILGGNQDDRIKFSPFYIDAVPPLRTKKGKIISDAFPDHLVFLLPTSYTNPKENGPEKLEIVDCAKLNALCEINTVKKKRGGASETR